MGQISIQQRQSLCQQCGMCCNGVIFANLKLACSDDVRKLSALLPLKIKPRANSGSPVASCQFSQPCTALKLGKCTIYRDRPRYCREFQCLLFQRVIANEIELAVAAKKIRSVLKLVEKAWGLLETLGDKNARQPLFGRFRKTMRRAEARGLTVQEAHCAGKLSQVMHRISLALAQDFYPGS